MASNYIIYPYGDKDTPQWRDTGIKVMNQPAVNIGEITTAFASDTWNNLGGNSFVPFAVNEDAAITSSTWVLAKYSYVNSSTTGLANLTAIHNAIASAVASSSYDNVKDLHAHNSYSTYEGISIEFTHASYNWSSVDTSGYTYSDGFASTMSGNEDYPTDYFSKATDLQSPRVGSKTQVISKIATNQTEIVEFIVKEALTQPQIHKLYIQLKKDGIIT